MGKVSDKTARKGAKPRRKIDIFLRLAPLRLCAPFSFFNGRSGHNRFHLAGLPVGADGNVLYEVPSSLFELQGIVASIRPRELLPISFSLRKMSRHREMVKYNHILLLFIAQ